MNKEFEAYIDKIIYYLGVNGKQEKQIRDDLYNSLIEKQECTGENNPYELLGAPEEIAEEFRENLNITEEKPNQSMYMNYINPSLFEYTSRTKIFGIPLIHVNLKPFGVAKGIISIGSISIGVLSIGAISFGILSLGAIGFGIILALGGFSISGVMSFGGIAIAGLAAFGGMAISYGISFGGLAIAKILACGGYAKANIAIGGIAKGVIAVYKQHGSGTYLFKFPANSAEVINAIKRVYPNTGDWMIKLIKSIISNMY